MCVLSTVHQATQDVVHLLHQMTAAVAAVMMIHHLLVVARQPPVAPLVRTKNVVGRHVVNMNQKRSKPKSEPIVFLLSNNCVDDAGKQNLLEIRRDVEENILAMMKETMRANQLPAG